MQIGDLSEFHVDIRLIILKGFMAFARRKDIFVFFNKTIFGEKKDDAHT